MIAIIMPKKRVLSMAELIICPSTGTDHNIIKLANNPARLLPIKGAKRINSSTNIMVINDPQAIIALIVCSIRPKKP
tara:strand:+ start:823 stop:1053 length:231 start_codon:yes stop_codon:yes gene_type:complete